MANKKAKGPSIRGYFISLFLEHPEFLSKERGTNEKVLDQWQADHAGEELTDKVKQSMSNAKSFVQRSNETGRQITPGRKRGRPRKSESMAAAANAPAVASVAKAAPVAVTAAPSGKLVNKLEIALDDCMYTANQAGAEKLVAVIDHLREARRALIKMS